MNPLNEFNFTLTHLPNIELEGSKSGTEWTFTGKTKPEETVSISQIRKQFLPSATDILPVEDMSVSNVVLEFKVDEKDQKQLYQVKLEAAVGMTWDVEVDKKYAFHFKKVLFEIDQKRNASFRFEVETFHLSDVGITLDFIKDVTMKNVHFEIKYKEKQIQSQFKGTINIKDFDFTVDLKQDHDKEKGNYLVFFGEIQQQYSLEELGFFLGEIKKVIPESIKGLTVKKLVIQYNSLYEMFNFEARIQDVLHFDFDLSVFKTIAVKQCSFVFQTSKDKTESSIIGDVAIGNTTFVTKSNVSDQTGLALELYNQDTMALNYVDLIETITAQQLAVWDVIPSFFQRLAIKTLYWKMQTSPINASLQLDTEAFGSIYTAMGILNEASFGMIALITPPKTIPFHLIAPQLSSLETIDLSGSYFILSSYDSSQIKKGDLPSLLKEETYVDGVTLCATMSLDPSHIQDRELREKIVFLREHIVDIQKLGVKATIGLDPSKISIEGFIGTIALGGGYLELSKAGLNLSASLDATLFGTIGLNLEQLLGIKNMSFSMYLRLNQGGVVGYGIWEGSLGTEDVKQLKKTADFVTDKGLQLIEDAESSKAMMELNQDIYKPTAATLIHSLPDFQIRKLGLILGINPSARIPTFGCVGEFTLDGDGLSHWGVVAFVFDSTNPTQFLLELKMPKGMQRSLENFAFKFENFLMNWVYDDWTSVSEQLKRNGIFSLLNFDGFYQDTAQTQWVPLRLKLALSTVKIGNTFYDQGFIIQGKVALLNDSVEALLNVKVSKQGVYGFGKMQEILVKFDSITLLSIAKSQRSVESVDKILKENIEVANPIFDGAYILLDAPVTQLWNAKVSGTAYIYFLGQSLDTSFAASSKGISFSFLVKSPFGASEFRVVVDSIRSFEALSGFNVTYQIGSYNVKIEGEIQILLKLNAYVVKLDFGATFYNPVVKQNQSLGRFVIQKNDAFDFDSIFHNIKEEITHKVATDAAAVFESIERFVEELKNQIANLSTEVQQLATEVAYQLDASKRYEQLIAKGGEAKRLIQASFDETLNRIKSIEKLIGEMEYRIQELSGFIRDKQKELERVLSGAVSKLAHIIGNVNQVSLHFLRSTREDLRRKRDIAELNRRYHERYKHKEWWYWSYHQGRELGYWTEREALTVQINLISSVISDAERIEKEIHTFDSDISYYQRHIHTNTHEKQNVLSEKSRLEGDLNKESLEIQENERLKAIALNRKSALEGEKSTKETEISDKQQQLDEISSHRIA